MANIQRLERTARRVLGRVVGLLEEGIARFEAWSGRIASAPREDSDTHVETHRPMTPAEWKEGAAAPEKGRPLDQAQEPRPEAFVVSRVAGEGAAFSAPVPLTEDALRSAPAPEEPGPRGGTDYLPPLPAAYHDDTFVALARDPFTLWVMWDFAAGTVEAAREGLRSPRTKLRIFQEGQLSRDLDFALESGSYYVAELEPGRRYVAEIVYVGDNGERRIGSPSNPVDLPPVGRSFIVDDRFATLPWTSRLSRGLDLFARGAPDEGAELEEEWLLRRRGGASDWIFEGRRRADVGSGSRYEHGAGRGRAR